jgi:hypothetical protein
VLPAVPAPPGETRIGPRAWGAAGGGIAAVLWIRLMFLDAAPDLPSWLAEGLTTGLIVGLACAFALWRGRRDRVAEGAKGFAAVFIFYMAVNFLSELIFG